MWSDQHVGTMLGALDKGHMVAIGDNHTSEDAFVLGSTLLKRAKKRGALCLEVSSDAQNWNGGVQKGIEEFASHTDMGLHYPPIAKLAASVGWSVQCVDCTDMQNPSKNCFGKSFMCKERQIYISKMVDKVTEIFGATIFIIGDKHMKGWEDVYAPRDKKTGKKPKVQSIQGYSDLSLEGKRLYDTNGKLFAQIFSRG